MHSMLHAEFAEGNSKNEQLRGAMIAEFHTASVEIQKEAHSAVMEMFTSKAIENGHLWRGLAEAQSQNMRLSLQKSIGEVREAVDATIQREVAEALNSRGMAQVETRFHEIKNWMKDEIGGLTQNLQHVHKAQSRMETPLVAHGKLHFWHNCSSR